MAVILPQRVSLAKFRLIDNSLPEHVRNRLFLTPYYTLARVCYNTALALDIDLGTTCYKREKSILHDAILVTLATFISCDTRHAGGDSGCFASRAHHALQFAAGPAIAAGL